MCNLAHGILVYTVTKSRLALTPAAIWTDDVLAAHKETPAYHASFAFVTVEAGAMPVFFLKRNELGSTDTSYWLRAAETPFSELFPVAFSTVRQLILGRELLSSKFFLTARAGEAFPVPGHPVVADPALVNHLLALAAALGVLALVARHTNRLVIAGDEAGGSNGLTTLNADKAFIVPLLPPVLKFLHSSSKWLTTLVAPDGETVIITVGAVDVLVLRGERLVHQGALAAETLEALLMPMVLFVGQVLKVGTDGLTTLLTRVGVLFLEAGDAVGVLFLDDVPAGYQLLGALMARQWLYLKGLFHRCVCLSS
jgi:hypothetical protein